MDKIALTEEEELFSGVTLLALFTGAEIIVVFCHGSIYWTMVVSSGEACHYFLRTLD